MNKDEAKHYLTGPVMSLQTPFDKDGNIDYQGVRNFIDVSIEGGSRTVMLTAGDSHYICLSEQEITELTRVTCEHTAGRAMVISADRYYNTAQAVEFAEYSKSLGVDMAMTMPPDWGGSATAESFAEHYRAVADVMPMMIVTNVFVPRGKAFGLETIRRAVDLSENVLAVKDDMCGVFACELCMEFYDRCAIIAGGQKINHMNMWPYGCDGYLSTFVSYNPTMAQNYYNAITNNDIPNAVKVIKEQDMPFFNFILSFPGGFDSAMHGMLELYGIADRHRRKPYYTITDLELEKLAEFLKQHKML